MFLPADDVVRLLGREPGNLSEGLSGSTASTDGR
jgi:hypothetical protein